MVTLGKSGSLHARRTALATLRHKDVVRKLFEDIAQRSTERNGGYTRIIRLGRRKSDSAPMAFIEWVDVAAVREEKPAEEKAATKRKEKSKSEPNPEAKQEEVKLETAKEEKPVEPTPEISFEEPKPKKRRWFGRKSSEEK